MSAKVETFNSTFNSSFVELKKLSVEMKHYIATSKCKRYAARN